MKSPKKEQGTTLNLLELVPKRNLQFEMKDEEIVILLVPKFRNRMFTRWVLPRMKKKFFHVKLDAYGSFIWNHCDGTRRVEEIWDLMKRRFGDDFDPTYGRIQRFIQTLLNDKFIIPEGIAQTR